MATTYIYWLQRTQKATCLYFLYSLLHQSMILMGFWKLTFVSKLFFLIFMSENGFLDSAHDAMSYYLYCRKNDIQPFIDLNEKRGISKKYKDDFTIGKDGVPICKAGRKMNHDGSEPSKTWLKFRCPLASRKYGCSCSTKLPAQTPNMGKPFILQ